MQQCFGAGQRVVARTGAEGRWKTNFPPMKAQAEGLTFAEAAARVAVVDEVRELLEHNIREAAAIPRMARAFSRPARG